MKVIMQKTYEEIFDRSFKEESTLLKDDKLMDILLKVHQAGKVKISQLKSLEDELNKLFRDGYITNLNGVYILTYKGVNFLKLLGISGYYNNPELKDNIHENTSIYNYFEIQNLTSIQIYNNLSVENQVSNEFLKFDKKNSSVICALMVNCLPNINDFLFKLRSLIDDNTQITIYYQDSHQRWKYLSKSYRGIKKPIAYIIDISKRKLKNRYLKKGTLNQLLFYNMKTSRAEMLGRISYSGYRILEEEFSDDNNSITFLPLRGYRIPSINEAKSSLLITLPRIGLNGKIIHVYKFRTMYPYSEYLQDYIYQVVELKPETGLINDFRLTPFGKFARKLWLDELPMIINFFKGELKIVGVRALSNSYLDLYPPELKQLRSKYKPGLIPSFYADLPYSLQEIIESEYRYLKSYALHPIKTDLLYFYKSLFNVYFRKARSM